MMAKTPVGVGKPPVPVDTLVCSTSPSLSNRRSVWRSMEMMICRGPCGLRAAGTACGRRAASRARCALRVGTVIVASSATSMPSSSAPFRAPWRQRPAAGPSPSMRRMRPLPRDRSETQLSLTRGGVQAGRAGIGNVSVTCAVLQLAEQPCQLALLGLAQARRQSALEGAHLLAGGEIGGLRCPLEVKRVAAPVAPSTSRRINPRFSSRTTTGLMVDFRRRKRPPAPPA